MRQKKIRELTSTIDFCNFMLRNFKALLKYKYQTEASKREKRSLRNNIENIWRKKMGLKKKLERSMATTSKPGRSDI